MRTVSELLDLRGKSALVSGGSGGIGRAIVERLIEQGARVAVVDRPDSAFPAGAMAWPVDLTDAQAIAGLSERVAGLVDPVDLFVHSAGITRDGMLWKLSATDWRDVHSVNLDAAFHIMQLVVPTMRLRKRGCIVLVASINGERGKVGQANYSASKAGLIALARTAARELGRDGIRVNALSPGLILTEMTKNLPEDVLRRAIDESALARPGTPDDVARTVLFLLSEMSSHITGQVLRVDGGQLMA